MEFVRKTVDAQHYLYVDRETEYGPGIADAMGSAFGEVFAFISEHGIEPLSMPMSVYLEMDPSVLRFRGGVIVKATDAGKATGNVNADTLPAGDVMTTTHVGPYDGLTAAHRAMWRHMADNAIEGRMPVWEIFVDDPAGMPPADVRTELYRMIR